MNINAIVVKSFMIICANVSLIMHYTVGLLDNEYNG